MIFGNPDDYKSILDGLSDGLYVTNRDRKIIYWNRTAENLTGFCHEKVVGSYCYDNILMHVDENGTSLCNTLCPLAKTIQDGQSRNARVFLHHADGQRVPVIVRINPILDSNNEIIGASELFTDDSAALAALERINTLEKEAYIDLLTEVGNRRYSEVMLQKFLFPMGENTAPGGLLLIDVDHFKDINDHHGHLTGDRVLRMVAKTIQHNLYASDFVGRWGGDEFLVLLHGVDAKKIDYVANKLRILVASAILVIGEESVRVTISIGGTPIGSEDSEESLLSRADQGLYSVKKSGRNDVKIILPGYAK